MYKSHHISVAPEIRIRCVSASSYKYSHLTSVIRRQQWRWLRLWNYSHLLRKQLHLIIALPSHRHISFLYIVSIQIWLIKLMYVHTSCDDFIQCLLYSVVSHHVFSETIVVIYICNQQFTYIRSRNVNSDNGYAHASVLCEWMCAQFNWTL